jgi:prolyl oligopeptidase
MFKLRYILYTGLLSLGLIVAFNLSLIPNFFSKTNDEQKFLELLDKEFIKSIEDNPIYASYMGDLRFNTIWPDFSIEKINTDHEHTLKVIEELEMMNVDDFSDENKLNYRLFVDGYKNSADKHQYQIYLLPFSHRGGIQLQHETAESLPLRNFQQYMDWISRLEKLDDVIDQYIAIAMEGIENQVMPPKVLMSRVLNQIKLQNVDSYINSPFYDAFEVLPDEITKEEQKQIREQAQITITNVVIPSYVKLLNFFEDSYYPNCRDTIGISDIKDGSQYYELIARQFTTTELTPDEIHNIGLSEVSRIKNEMFKVMDNVQWNGSFDEFLNFLRTDSQFYFETGEELFTEYLATSKRIDPLLVKLFKDLPSMPYGLKPIPMESAPDTTTAYYQRPAADGSRAGYYYVNLYMPEVRPKYEIEALSLHEAMPGHHLQIAYTMELDLPNFRKYGGYTAFVEGWGLYAESLGEDLGMYKDPYSKFGQLTYEMWRAVRLVVDTGMHYKGWSRQQAIEYFLDNAAKTKQDVINEIDRYIIGELKIKELRAISENELGDKFDIKEFHHEVLRHGGIPLYVLEENINSWINQQIN